MPVQIVHATRGKRTRAEPVAALYEQGRVHHVGAFAALEDQLCLWDATSGDLSPDRLDALVWAVTQLAVDGQPELGLVSSLCGDREPAETTADTSAGSMDFMWQQLRRP